MQTVEVNGRRYAPISEPLVVVCVDGCEPDYVSRAVEAGVAPWFADVMAKGTALVYALVLNNPFVDGNKRVGHAALEAFLMLKGKQLDATVDDAERCSLDLAAGILSREPLRAWIEAHLIDR